MSVKPPSSLAAADGILPGLRYRSVEDAPGRARRLSARLGTLGALAGLAALLAGCARDAEPRVFAVPSAAAARIRMICPPGTFVGAMAANCPQPLRRPPPPGQ